MLRMFRPYNFSWIAGCFSVTMAPRYEMCVGMEKGHKTTKNVQKVEFFNFVKCVQPVLRIHLILMRIRILNPHWKKMDPDPGYFFWWTIQKWGHFYNLFFQKFRVEFSSKDFFAVFGWYFTPWIWIQEAKILRSPRIRIPDPKHCNWTMILSSFSTSKSTFFLYNWILMTEKFADSKIFFRTNTIGFYYKHPET